MNLEAQKMRFEEIDKCFSDLKRNPMNVSAIRRIERYLSEVYNQSFAIIIVPTKRTDSCFVMSIFPELSTIDKIVDSIIKEESVNVVYELWRKNTHWNIEIDRRVLDDTVAPISSRECTALLLHEIGHTVQDNTIPERIVRVIKYEFATMGSDIKSVFKTDQFKKLLSLPIVDSCSTISTTITNHNNLKREMGADKYAKMMGYGEELSSALHKFSSTSFVTDPTASMKNVMYFSKDIVSNFKKRQAYLNKKNLLQLTESASPITKEIMTDMYEMCIESMTKKSPVETHWQTYMCNVVNRITDEYYTEFFIGKKKLKKLDEYDLDYIQVEIDKIKTHDDKLLILSYIRSKLDIVDYYISIMENTNYAKKYSCPHNLDYLLKFKSRLEMLNQRALTKKINENPYHFSFQYPEGYEG